MAISISKHEIDATLPKIKEGLGKYLWLQNQVGNDEAFYKSPEFRRKFNYFYRVRRGEKWQQEFYALMNVALEKKLTFDAVLNQLHKATSRMEASFASKLYATINPSAPVIDSIVLRNVGLRLPYVGAHDRADRICQIHVTLGALFDAYLQTKDGVYLVDMFDREYSEARVRITDQKKLDLVLWQLR